MPKSSKTKYYAVKVGRDGPRIYTNWEECKTKVTRYPGAIHRSFTTRALAEEWLSRLTPESSFESKQYPSVSTEKTLCAIKKSMSTNGQILSAYNTVEEQLLGSPTFYSDSMPVVAGAQNIEEPSFGNEGGYDGYIPLDWEPHVKLSVQQSNVLNRVKEGNNIFFTGSAGTGKSVLLREIIRTLGGPGSPGLGITASTGIAAVNINGTTLHSWAGIGLGQESVEKLHGKLTGQRKLFDVLQRWKRARCLIIDEISMVDGSLFDKLEELARLLRQDNRPFGGIQLVLCGDFCQLPPVTGRDTKGQNIEPVFVFDSNAWKTCIKSSMTLEQVFRQKDKVFVDVLNSIRFGRVDSNIENLFRNLSRNITYGDGIQPTELFSTRAEVENANQSRLRALAGESRTYRAYDSAGYDSNGRPVTIDQMNRLLERLIAPTTLTLKVGAQVMLIKNLVQGELVNGSLGIVTRFASITEARKQRKEYISNCSSSNSWLAGVDEDTSSIESEGLLWPVVKFTNEREMLIIPREFTVLNAEGKMEASRKQVPIILAYALSVHKSQGQTLQRVKVDLKRVFERGQAYVALSRATSLETLQVLNFNSSKVAAHPRVLSWYGQASIKDTSNDEMDNEEAIIAYYTA